ncbi:MAG TPA: toll/interleukin-1 receptor domain-containing protein [Pyrinomonadaceae bacterium]|jgi:hypothetical protein
MRPIEQDPWASPAEEAEREAEAVADMEAGEADEAAPPEAEARPVVFVSHRCIIEPDRSIALRLREDLSADCDVYVNTAEPAGADFDKRIEDSLETADFVIALISESANESPWVKYELSYAAERYQRERRPTIIPVRLGFTAQYSPTVGASIRGFNPIEVEPGDYDELLKRVKATIDGRPPEIDASIFGIEAFLVGEFRKNLTRAASLDSPELRRAVEELRSERLFWVVGDAGVRNHFARSLAVQEHDREVRGGKGQGRGIYEVTRSLGWSRVNDTLVRDSVIIFPDVKPSVLFDEESRRDELQSLKSLAARNLVIVTVSEDSYDEINQEMRDRDFAGGARVTVGHGFYGERAKSEIFGRLLDFSHQSRDISERQHQWARKVLEGPEGRELFRTTVNKWTPTDIERFVTRHLGQARRQGDILKLLQRSADLDNEIHTWFIALDDSTRCFVLALSMLSGLRKEQLWEKYKLIVERLKRLDSNLSLWPLGICRQRAALYVTTEGQLDFVDERIAEAVSREVTINFREYLIELVPLIKEMTVPPGRDQRLTEEAFAARKLKAAEDKELRVALARVVGKAGRQGLEDLTGLLNFWGADPMLQVREAVALSLEQTVTESTGAKHALGLLEKWCGDAPHRRDALCRTWAAASALGSIAAARPGTDTCLRSLSLLERLAGRTGASVRLYVSIALKKPVRKLPLAGGEEPSLATLLSLVARDEKVTTKVNVAEALIEARMADEAAAVGLIREWASGADADCRWAAICSLLLWRKQKDWERSREIAGFLAEDAQTTAQVLVEILNHKHQKMAAVWQSFKRLVSEAEGVTRRALVAGLAGLSQASLEKELLPRLRASNDPQLSGLLAEVRSERWRQMFSNPPEFVADLRKEIQRGRTTGEVYTALLLMLKPEPEGCRRELVQTLVSCFAECRDGLYDLLARLTSISPQVFEPLAVEVRCEGLRGLFPDPLSFVAVVAEGLGRADLAGETCVALELLAQPGPRGRREEVLHVLTHAQSLNAAAVRALLRQLRGTFSRTLGRLASDFNLRLLDADLSSPERFLSAVAEAMRDADERAEVVPLLRQLSAPEPEGRRRALVQTLGAARAARPQAVDQLLRDQSWQAPAGLFSFGTQVKLFSFLHKTFSPRLAYMIFAPKP